MITHQRLRPSKGAEGRLRLHALDLTPVLNLSGGLVILSGAPQARSRRTRRRIAICARDCSGSKSNKGKRAVASFDRASLRLRRLAPPLSTAPLRMTPHAPLRMTRAEDESSWFRRVLGVSPERHQVDPARPDEQGVGEPVRGNRAASTGTASALARAPRRGVRRAGGEVVRATWSCAPGNDPLGRMNVLSGARSGSASSMARSSADTSPASINGMPSQRLPTSVASSLPRLKSTSCVHASHASRRSARVEPPAQRVQACADDADRAR